MEEKTVIEINGVKFEVDLRNATKIEHFKVGDCVKVLFKKTEYTPEKLINGIIVDFLQFKTMPTIQIAIFEESYNNAAISFVDYNSASTNIEIVPCTKHELTLEKNGFLNLLDRDIRNVEEKVADLKNKRKFFVEQYGKYFEKKDDNNA